MDWKKHHDIDLGRTKHALEEVAEIARLGPNQQDTRAKARVGTP